MTLLCRSTLKDSKTSSFAIFDFSMIYYEFPNFQPNNCNKQKKKRRNAFAK